MILEQVVSRHAGTFDVATAQLGLGRDGLVYLTSGGRVLRVGPNGEAPRLGQVGYSANNVTADVHGMIATSEHHFPHRVAFWARPHRRLHHQRHRRLGRTRGDRGRRIRRLLRDRPVREAGPAGLPRRRGSGLPVGRGHRVGPDVDRLAACVRGTVAALQRLVVRRDLGELLRRNPAVEHSGPARRELAVGVRHRRRRPPLRAHQRRSGQAVRRKRCRRGLAHAGTAGQRSRGEHASPARQRDLRPS